MQEKDLMKNTWYYGVGRNAPVGLWNGHYFLTLGYCFKKEKIYMEPYDTFRPLFPITKLTGGN